MLLNVNKLKICRHQMNREAREGYPALERKDSSSSQWMGSPEEIGDGPMFGI